MKPFAIFLAACLVFATASCTNSYNPDESPCTLTPIPLNTEYLKIQVNESYICGDDFIIMGTLINCSEDKFVSLDGVGFSDFDYRTTSCRKPNHFQKFHYSRDDSDGNYFPVGAFVQCNFIESCLYFKSGEKWERMEAKKCYRCGTGLDVFTLQPNARVPFRIYAQCALGPRNLAWMSEHAIESLRSGNPVKIVYSYQGSDCASVESDEFRLTGIFFEIRNGELQVYDKFLKRHPEYVKGNSDIYLQWFYRYRNDRTHNAAPQENLERIEKISIFIEGEITAGTRTFYRELFPEFADELNFVSPDSIPAQ